MKAIRNITNVVQHIGGYRVEPGAVVELPERVAEGLLRLRLFELCERRAGLSAEVRAMAHPWPRQEPWVQALNAESCGRGFLGPPKPADKPIAVAFFVPPINELNGGAQVTIRLAGYLAARGHDVTLVAPRLSFEPSALHPVAVTAGPLERPVDVAVGTFWPTIPPALKAPARARAVLLQSNEAAWLKASDRHRPLAERLLSRTDVYYIAISRHVAAWCEADLGTNVSHVLPGCGVDCIDFSPRVNDFSLRKRMCGILRGAWFKNDGFVTEVARRMKSACYGFGLTVASFEDLPAPEADERLVNPSREAMALMYSRSDFYVSGSLIEGSPLPPLEAMACGCIPVVTRVGTEDYLRDGVNGIIIDPRDPDAAVEAMLGLAADEERRLQMVYAALKTAQERPWERLLQAAEDALVEIALSAARSGGRR